MLDADTGSSRVLTAGARTSGVKAPSRTDAETWRMGKRWTWIFPSLTRTPCPDSSARPHRSPDEASFWACWGGCITAFLIRFWRLMKSQRNEVQEHWMDPTGHFMGAWWTMVHVKHKTVMTIERVTKIMVKSRYSPISGMTRDVEGMISVMSNRKTVRERRTEIHNVIFSPQSDGR